MTSKKPNISALCDFIHCDRTDDSFNGSILACGHGYHSYCLQRCQYKCLICLNYLQDEVKKNVDALMISLTSLTKEQTEAETINEDNENAVENDSDDATGDIATIANQLNNAKKSFLEL